MKCQQKGFKLATLEVVAGRLDAMPLKVAVMGIALFANVLAASVGNLYPYAAKSSLIRRIT